MRQIEIAGMRYGPEEVADLAEELGTIRDEALKQGAMGWAVILSHTIGLLNSMSIILNDEL